LDDFMADAAGLIEAPFEGRVDAAEAGEVRGWVWFPSAPEEAAVIEIVIDGEVRGRVVADEMRGDLAEAGKRSGRCGFSWEAPNEPVTLTVRLADGRELPGSPLVHVLPFEGRLDLIDPHRVAGWCWFPTRPDLILRIRVRAGAAIVGEGFADQYRVDLKPKRDGRCAFDFSIPSLWEARVTTVVVELEDGRPLPLGEFQVPPCPPTVFTAEGGQWPRRLLGVDGYIESFGERIQGWVAPIDHGPPLVLSICEGETEIFTIEGKDWRKDLEDAYEGDGCGGFDIAAPMHIRDGQTRMLDIRFRGQSLISEPFAVTLAPAEEGEQSPDPLSERPVQRWPRRLIGVEGCIESFAERIQGWAVPIDRGPAVVLSVCEGDAEIFTIEAKDWRKDLEDAHQGDGRGGFDVEAPMHMRDGRTRVLDIRYRGRSLIREPFSVTLTPATSPEPVPPPLSERLLRRGKDIIQQLKPVDFSFIVNFYNMQREAERTLTSLTRAYQRNSEGIKYEVICVDNGSNPPLDENWIKSFGPEFRLVRPSKLLPSPCFAINEAAQQARGKHVVIVVDGAHVLTPGVMFEAKQAIKQHPKTVVAIRHWFIGGDQRWLSAAGYTRELEDILFARARWPTDGYKLFEISTTMHENPNHWFDPIAESNCLFVPADLWRRMDGMDESFSEPGGGFCNLDLLRRAGAMADDGVTALLGEATFHQFHEGTTTNVTDAEKDSRVRTYAAKYRHMRGEEFANIDTPQLRLRGRMQTYRCYSTRQRPLYQAPLGVTTRVRPGSMDRWLDLGAIEYINSAYVESGLHEKTRWRGEQINLAPADLTNLQEILHDVRPDRIVISKHEPEVIRFLDDIARLEGLDDMRIVCVVDGPPDQTHPRVDYIVGAPYAEETLARVEVAVGPVENTLVLFSAREDDYFPLAGLRAYSRFVSFRSYLVVLRTALGQPWLGYSMYWLKRVIFLFLKNSDFAADETRDQHLVTMCSAGYLLRVRPPKPDAGDDALEDLGL
jgi:cephalosporin hydroxylase